MGNITKSCKNCNQTLQGKYCHFCGEKIVENQDFSVKTIFREAVDGFTNVDSKFLKSFKYLLLKPGKLTALYVEGIRKPFMKPIQIFLIANLLFFFFLPKSDILRIPSAYYFSVDFRADSLKTKSLESGISEQELMQLYDSKSATYSKALVFVIIPFFALFFAIINIFKKYQFGKHIIFATHYFSFFLLFCVLLLLIPYVEGNAMVIQTAIVAVNFIYLLFALKSFYRDGWFISGIKALIGVAGCIFIALQYRGLVSDLSLLLLNTNL